MMFRNNEMFKVVALMLRWPAWLRILLGCVAVLLCVILSWLLSGILGSLSIALILPGALFFFYLNPELMSGI